MKKQLDKITIAHMMSPEVINMLYSIGKFAKQIGVTTHTLRQWHKEGSLIPAKVTHGGTRYYSDDQLKRYLGAEPCSEGRELANDHDVTSL